MREHVRVRVRVCMRVRVRVCVLVCVVWRAGGVLCAGGVVS